MQGQSNPDRAVTADCRLVFGIAFYKRSNTCSTWQVDRGYAEKNSFRGKKGKRYRSAGNGHRGYDLKQQMHQGS